MKQWLVILLASWACLAWQLPRAESSAKLYIHVTPKNADITIWNIKPKYKWGMRLPSGRYDIQVSKTGYITHREWITLGDKNRHYRVKLEPKSYPLYIETEPEDAQITLWNIKPKYSPGMTLPLGKYDVEVSAPGYQGLREWVEVGAGETRVEFVLEPEEGTIASEAGGQPLYIRTHPEEADITIWNIKPPFSQGMLLAPGEYDIEITHPGHQAWRRLVTLPENEALRLDVTLAPSSLAPGDNPGKDKADAGSAPRARSTPARDATPGRHALYVNPFPGDATIKVMNIKPKFEQGIRLPPGKYHLQISKPGYPTRTRWVDIGEQDVSVDVRLSPPPQCFFAREANANSKIEARRVELRFYDRYVEAVYLLHVKSSGAVEQFHLIGARQGNTLDLIGTVYYGDQAAELRSHMSLRDNHLTVEFDGETRVLQQVACP